MRLHGPMLAKTHTSRKTQRFGVRLLQRSTTPDDKLKNQRFEPHDIWKLFYAQTQPEMPKDFRPIYVTYFMVREDVDDDQHLAFKLLKRGIRQLVYARDHQDGPVDNDGRRQPGFIVFRCSRPEYYTTCKFSDMLHDAAASMGEESPIAKEDIKYNHGLGMIVRIPQLPDRPLNPLKRFFQESFMMTIPLPHKIARPKKRHYL